MKEIVRQRLVGVLILVALGVVFWPIIFVEPGVKEAPRDSRVPARPEVDTTPLEPPDRVGLRVSPEVVAVAPEEQAVTEALPQPGEVATAPAPAVAPSARSAAPERPSLDSQGVPVAWTIQVATVSSAANADQLRDRLLARHYEAYVRRVAHGDRELYRVFVGPKFERAKLERLQQEIDKNFGVKSIITRYVP